MSLQCLIVGCGTTTTAEPRFAYGQPQTPTPPQTPVPKGCYDFASEVERLANANPELSNVAFRDLLMDRFSARTMEFGSDGFKPEFQDYSGSPNQARHYVGGLFAGFLGNPLGGSNFGAVVSLRNWECQSDNLFVNSSVDSRLLL
jgi:hypothetical protein